MKHDLQISKTFRNNCPHCKRPDQYCYCAQITPIDSKIKFVILIHPIEARRKIATGRMAHLCLRNSVLICGDNFTDHLLVNSIIDDSKNNCALLYPKKGSLNLSADLTQSKNHFLNDSKTPVLFIIDGTWSTAKKTMRLSTNLQQLPAICFTPQTPSQFHIRKQPASHCYSTIEAIDTILGLIEFKEEKKESKNILMKVFHEMVEQQLKFTN